MSDDKKILKGIKVWESSLHQMYNSTFSPFLIQNTALEMVLK